MREPLAALAGKEVIHNTFPRGRHGVQLKLEMVVSRAEAMSDSGSEITIREAGPEDVPAMVACRADDPEMGPADARMGRYLMGEHHPQHALAPRVIYVAIDRDSVVGYIGGHLTRRFDCDGELQYLYVATPQRRMGIASRLLQRLVAWFAEHDAARICVDVMPENARARAFYARHGAVELSEYWMVWTDIHATAPNGARR